jgi:hypothetical protein
MHHSPAASAPFLFFHPHKLENQAATFDDVLGPDGYALDGAECTEPGQIPSEIIVNDPNGIGYDPDFPYTLVCEVRPA